MPTSRKTTRVSRQVGFNVVCPFCGSKNDPDRFFKQCRCGAEYSMEGDGTALFKIRNSLLTRVHR